MRRRNVWIESSREAPEEPKVGGGLGIPLQRAHFERRVAITAPVAVAKDVPQLSGVGGNVEAYNTQIDESVGAHDVWRAASKGEPFGGIETV